MSRPIILGMCDPSASGEALGFDTWGAGKRLFLLSGMTKEEYVAAFTRINLIGSRNWRTVKARLAGEKFVREKQFGQIVIVLGRETWRSLGFPPVNPCKRIGEYIFVPHPSGRNLMYNSPAIRKQVGKLLRRIANGQDEDQL